MQKKMLPRYIPQEVLDQLIFYLDSLPIQIKRIVIILLVSGMRVSELCSLPYDCLVQEAAGYWFLRYNQLKLQTDRIISVSNMAAAVIKEQQKALENEQGGNMRYLFPNSKGRPLSQQTFINILNRLAREKDIRNATGEIWRFQARQFRYTQMMGHRSPSPVLQSSVNPQRFGYCTFSLKEIPCPYPIRNNTHGSLSMVV